VTDFDAHAYLGAHYNLEAGMGAPASVRERGAPTLERITQLLTYLGGHDAYPVVHLTGTNGKTSTARMITQLLVTAGFRVGAYTSPNLETVNERIALNGAPITDEALAEALYAVSLAEAAAGVDASYFEVMTAAAIRYFDDEAVDVAVVEVGLGGTWDATNVLDASVAVVTNVSIDHVEYLGPTRQEIANEKAGIIKPDSVLVLGETDDELDAIFTARPARFVRRRGPDFGVRNNVLAVGGRVIDLYTPRAAYGDVMLALHGAYQADNAAIALAAAEEFGGEALDDDVVREAFATVQSPGRLEVVGRNPLILLDGAHNVAGAEALRAALDEEFDSRSRSLVVGFLREKDPLEMLTALGIDDVDGLVVCCRAPSPRAHDPADVAKAARELGVDEARIEVVDSVAEAIGTVLLAAPEDGQVVITGSLYTVGAARSIFVNRRGAS
jgi:dihydrofolate synthase/folylpolyglutamate synthase